MMVSTNRRRLLRGSSLGLLSVLVLINVSAPAMATTFGTVAVEGDYVYAINTIALNGDNFTTATNTTASGVYTRGVNTAAVNGDNVTDTGNVTVSGLWARGVIARTYADSSCGQNIVNVTGNISASYHGIVAFGCAGSTVNVGVGNTVTTTGESEGAIALINIATVATTNIWGSVSGAARDQRAFEARSMESSTTTIYDGGSLFGTFGGTLAPDMLLLQVGGEWSTAGTSDFGGGNDLLTNSGVVTAAGNTIFSNLAVLHNNGTLALEAGTFALPNSIDFTNTGTIRVLGGATTITSAAALVNNGTLNLQNGIYGDTLTITNGFTATANSVLLVDASLTSSDQLVIFGAVSGVTQVYISGLGALTTTISQIVTADAADPGAFVIVNNPTIGMTSYGLIQSGGKFYLYAAPSAIALQPLAVANVTQDMWHQSADIYSAYIASRRTDGGGYQKNGLSVWGQFFVNSDRYGGRNTQTVFGGDVDVDNRVRTDRHGVEAGIDLMPSDGQFLFGAMVGYQKAKADPRSSNGGIHADGYNLAAYAHFGGPFGLYGGVLVKADWNSVRLSNSAFDAADGNPNSRSVGVEGEAGYRWDRGSTTFDVGGQLAYVRTTVDGFSAQAIDYDYGRSNSLRGRLNAQVAFGGRLAPFVSAKLFHEFDGDSKLTLTSGDEFDHVDVNGRGTWARIEGGVGAQKGPGPLVAAWADFGDVKGFGLRAGYRF